MFKGNDVIPVPKGFVKSIEFLLSAHNVSLEEMPKDVSVPTTIETKSEEKVEFQTTDFNE
jgi:hypothetical protein